MKNLLYVSGSMPPLKCGIGFYTERLLTESSGTFDLLTTQGMHAHKNAGKTLFTPDWKVRSLPSLIKICRQYRIIHIQYPAVGYKRNLGINLLPYIIRLASRSKIVITLHEYHGSGFLGKTRNFITTLASHTIAVSNQYDLEKMPRILKRKARIIPIGSNIPVAPANTEYTASVMQEAGFSDTKKLAAFFGFAFASKGLEHAIDAAVKAKFQLLLITKLNETDSYHQSLLDKIARAKEEGAKIHVTGYQDNEKVSQLLQEADYFILPQTIPLTGKSGTAIAAVDHGLTVISTAAGEPGLNLPYVHTVNSILLNPMNSDAISDALAGDISISEAEVKKLKNYFSWDTIIKEHSRLYEEII